MSSTEIGRVTLDPHPADGRVGVLRIDRPPVNALSRRMWDELAEIGRQLHAAASPYRALVVTGGPHLAAGADVAELAGLDPDEFDRGNRVLQGAFQAIATAPQIVVAAVTGYALGGGCELALACDLRVAGRGARLGLPEITLGIIPGSGGTQRLGRLVGPRLARDMILTGRSLRAEEALAAGLVDEVCDDELVLGRAVERAVGFAGGPAALRHAKQALAAAQDLPLERGLALEADLITRCFRTRDAAAGLRGFVADGPGKARFTGD